MKNTIFKTLTILLSASAVMALTGCGNEGVTSDTQLVGSKTTTPPPSGGTPPPGGEIPPGGEVPPGETPIAFITDFSDPEMMADLKVKVVGIDYSDGTLKLALQAEDTTFPYIWIANSGEGTISKLDVKTGAELARYKTGPGVNNGNPSRTTVDQDGNVWVGNRAGNTITKVGLKEFDQCIDRNGNGKIDTSTGGTDIMDWNGTLGDGLGIQNAADECILQHVAMVDENGVVATPNDIRLVAITPDNNVFVGGYYSPSLFKVDNKTGKILAAETTKQGHYGGVVDKAGNLWSMSSGSGKVEKISPDMKTTELITIGHNGYGITIDKYGKVWTTEYGSRFSAFNPADPVNTLKVFTQTDHSYAQGVTTNSDGDVLIAGSLSGSTVGHYKQQFDADGNFTGVEFVANYPVERGPTGVAVDSQGKVWSSNYYADSISRIDLTSATVDTFPVGRTPYNYSDMTGNIVRTITTRQGTWEATLNAGKADYAWISAVWKVQEGAPEGTEVKVYVKAANTELDLNALEYTEVASGEKIQGITGQYMKVKITLSAKTSDTTPIVLEIKVF